MLKNTRIFFRLAALAGVLIAFMAGLVFMDMNSTSRINGYIKTIYEDRAVPLVQLAEVRDLLGDAREDIRSVAATSAAAELTTLEKAKTARDQKIEAIWDAYMATFLTPEEKKLAAKALSAKQAYEKIFVAVMTAARAGDLPRAQALESGDGDAAFAAVKTAFDDLKQLQADIAKELYEESMREFEQDRLVSFSALAIGLLIGSVVALVIGRSITSPLHNVIHAMQALTAGNLSVPVNGQDRGDEIGDVCRSVAVFKTSLEETERMRRERGEMEARAEGDRKAALLKMADDFENAVGDMVHGVAAASTEMQATAQTLAASSEQTKQQATTVAAAAEQTTQNVQTVASATEELSASFREISSRVSESSGIIAEAVTQAHGTSAQVRGLQEAAERIGTVVALITDIAEQTNLLALNATIEAARAGDAGKGFAVVASEVKVLSGQTAKATDEIRAQINAIQAATRGSAEAISAISKTISRVDEISTHIAAAVEQQTAATDEISRNVSQAAQGTAEVTVNVSGVSDAAMTSTAAAHDVLSAASLLSRNSEELSAQVNMFLSSIRSGGKGATEARASAPKASRFAA